MLDCHSFTILHRFGHEIAAEESTGSAETCFCWWFLWLAEIETRKRTTLPACLQSRPLVTLFYV